MTKCADTVHRNYLWSQRFIHGTHQSFAVFFAAQISVSSLLWNTFKMIALISNQRDIIYFGTRVFISNFQNLLCTSFYTFLICCQKLYRVCGSPFEAITWDFSDVKLFVHENGINSIYTVRINYHSHKNWYGKVKYNF